MHEEALSIAQPHSLLSLPAEIRLQIFAWLWGRRNVRFASPNMKHVVTARKKIYQYGTMVSKPQALPLWLQTCKQICREGLEWLRDNRDIIAEVDNQWWRKSTLFLHGLLVPLITTVMLGTNHRSCLNRWCWHERPSIVYEDAFKENIHPPTIAQIYFEDGPANRTYYWKIEKEERALLEGLIQRGAPIQEVHIGAWYGRAADRLEVRSCTKPVPQHGRTYEDEVADMNDLIRRAQFTKAQTATLLNKDGWHIDVPVYEHYSEADVPLRYDVTYDVYNMIIVRWRRDSGVSLGNGLQNTGGTRGDKINGEPAAIPGLLYRATF